MYVFLQRHSLGACVREGSPGWRGAVDITAWTLVSHQLRAQIWRQETRSLPEMGKLRAQGQHVQVQLPVTYCQLSRKVLAQGPGIGLGGVHPIVPAPSWGPGAQYKPLWALVNIVIPEFRI